MFLRHKIRGDLVEVLSSEDLFDPFKDTVQGRFHVGEEMPDVEPFLKTDLEFPSGEPLPRCWVDSHYRD
jgi:hypothetical protein